MPRRKLKTIGLLTTATIQQALQRPSQITPQNVAHLQAQWVFHTRTPGVLEGTPVVVNGIMYFTGSNDAFALNAQTGEVLWHYSRPVSSGLIDDASGHINRGVAISGTRLYMETDNATFSAWIIGRATSFGILLTPTGIRTMGPQVHLLSSRTRYWLQLRAEMMEYAVFSPLLMQQLGN